MIQEKPEVIPGLVCFIGAGPGSADLITLRGIKAIQQADLVLYAGSLVSPEILEFAKSSAQIRSSASLTLEETHALIVATASKGGLTARVHTGDPTLFGALAEQIALLNKDSIPWQIIPGITAATAAAAAAGISFSLPEKAQSLIITRLEGRTPMPKAERLADLASHGTSMAIYLSGQDPERLQRELSASLPVSTPIICASRVSWPDQVIVKTTLVNLSKTVKEHGMGRQTIFLILPASGEDFARSKLYDANFSHSFRSQDRFTGK